MMRTTNVPPKTPHRGMSPELLTTIAMSSTHQWNSTMDISLGDPIIMSNLMLLGPCFFCSSQPVFISAALLLWFNQSTFHLLGSSSLQFCSLITVQLSPISFNKNCFLCATCSFIPVVQSSELLDTWTLQSSVEWGFVNLSCFSWLDSKQDHLSDRRTFPHAQLACHQRVDTTASLSVLQRHYTRPFS